MAKHELVRPSRDGDQFHYHWAARQCLALLPGSGDLVAVSIEGPSTSERDTPTHEGDELVDVGLYYGSENFADARLVHYVQLKHSTRHAGEPWTASGLDRTLQGFASRYAKLLESGSASDLKKKVQFSFTTNRPIDLKVAEALADLAKGCTPRHPALEGLLLGYANLKGPAANEFFSIFRAEGSAPGLWSQRNLLSQDLSVFLTEADSDAPVQLKELVARKATSESEKDPSIRRYDVLRALKISEEGLLPAECLITAPVRLLPREQETEIRQIIESSSQPVVLHADGGVGKSVLALRLAEAMPAGSVSVLYDCFGDGMYRNALHFRHRYRDALPQIANELSARGLCYPLISSASTDAKAFMRAFVSRLEQSIAFLRATDPKAIVLIVVDAADNADLAAEEQGDPSVVRDLIRTQLPEGVKIVFTCRSHRRDRLNPPLEAQQIEVRPFTETETATHLRASYPNASDGEVQEFAFLSSHNPRVQALAISRGLSIDKMLLELGPAPSTVERAIGELLQRAVDRLKDSVGRVESRQIDLICQGLAVLRPLVPISVLAKLSGTPEGAIRSFAFDLGRPLLVKGESLHFLDEPAETWFRDRYKPDAENLNRFLHKLRPLAAGSSYVAASLPELLLSAGQIDELVNLALSGDGLPTSNPLERRDVEVQRLIFALNACLRGRHFAFAAKLALKAGGESAAAARQTRLIQENTDLASVLLAPDRIDELVSRRVFGSKWMGAHHAYDAGLLAGRQEFVAEARSRLRMAVDWLYAWSRLPSDRRERERVEDEDRAELGMAHLLALGAEEAARFLAGWRPAHLALRSGRLLARRLLDLGRHSELDALAAASSSVWLSLGIANEASKSRHELPAASLDKLMRALGRTGFVLSDPKVHTDRWEVLDEVTGAIVIALRVLPAAHLEWAELLHKYLPKDPPSDLADRFGFGRNLLLRAYALEASLRGEHLRPLDIAPPEVRKELEGPSTYSKSTETEVFRISSAALLPWFVLSAEIACGRTPADLAARVADAMSTTSSAASQDYHKQINTEQVAAIEWTRVLSMTSTLDVASLAALRAWASGKKDTLWSGTVTDMCWVASRTPGMAEFAMELAVSTFESLEQTREDAEQQSNSYQRLARAIYPVSKSEATVYFERGVELSSRIGNENLDRWSALLYLAEASSDKFSSKPRSAYRLARGAELTYTYVARDKHFEWDRTVDSLVGLCSSSALAILSRWRDRDFGDAPRLLRAALHGLVKAGKVPPIAPVALANLTDQWELFEDLQRVVESGLDLGLRRRILQVRYRYDRVSPNSETALSTYKRLSELVGVVLPDLERLLESGKAKAIAARGDNVRPPLDSLSATRKDPDWELLFADVDLASPSALRQAYLRLKTFDPPFAFGEFFAEGLRRSSPGGTASFVQAIAEWPELGVFELRYMLDAIPSASTKPVSFRRALRVVVLAACRNNPEYTRRRGWATYFPYDRIVGEEIATDSEIVGAILDGFTSKVTRLDAGELFLLLDPLASCLSPSEADDALNFGLDLVEEILQAGDGDGEWNDGLLPPAETNDALAGYMWAALASPVAASRWEAAHSVRACVELNWADLLTALTARASARSAVPFVDQRFVFYEWHARQWFLIGLARGAMDCPTAVQPAIPLLIEALQEEHVLVRHFAAESLKALHAAGLIQDSVVEQVKEVNSSPLAEVTYAVRREEQREVSAPGGEPDTDEPDYAFGIDIGPHWFAPLGRVFGLYEQAVERRAKAAIRQRFGVKDIGARSDARYKHKIFSGRETSHSHGTIPRVDDMRVYHSYHAMMIVAARLLKTHRIGRQDGSNKNDFAEWLEGRLLTAPDGDWLADRRDPQLSAPPPRRQGYSDSVWCWSVTAEYLDGQLLTDDGDLVLWGDWSSGHGDEEESVSIHSAIVAKIHAVALLAAAQTSSEPTNVYFATRDEEDEEEDEAPGEPCFGMSACVDGGNESLRLDEYDRWGERLHFPGPRPARSIVAALGLMATDDHRGWTSTAGARLRSETWTQRVGYGREEDVVPGTRLSANQAFFTELRKARPDECIVVAVSVSRRAPKSNDDGDGFERYQWPYVRYYLIDENGTARTL